MDLAKKAVTDTNVPHPITNYPKMQYKNYVVVFTNFPQESQSWSRRTFEWCKQTVSHLTIPQAAGGLP